MGIVDIKDTAGAVGAVGKTVIDIGKGIKTLITGKLDPELEAQIEQKWLELENAAMSQQNKINEIEAQSSNLFVSGWRPAIGWICGFSLAFEYILRPIAQWIIDIVRVGEAVALKLPGLDLGLMVPLLAGLLGLGTMRSVEKIKGAQGRH